jgi:oligopeptide transport system ATP-binding protein
MSQILSVVDLETQFPTPHGPVRAVNRISFGVTRGEIVGIVGESGSGKSVTARSILRIVPPPGKIIGGQVLLDGRDLLKLKEKEMQKVRGGKIAMVFQEPGAALNPVFTVGDQMLENLKIHRNVTGSAAKQIAADYFAQVGIPEPRMRLDAYPHQLSGGMQQRVTIAMALACSPQLLIADEPTTALDVTIQAQILDLLSRLAHEANVGMIFITHNIAAVAQIARRIIVMYAGKIVEEGTTEQVIDTPKHPYTQALLQAMPRLDATRGQTLFEIQGRVPDLSNLPTGCAFQPRCGFVMERCRVETPELTVIEGERRVACWLQDEKAAPRETAREKSMQDKGTRGEGKAFSQMATAAQ